MSQERSLVTMPTQNLADLLEGAACVPNPLALAVVAITPDTRQSPVGKKPSVRGRLVEVGTAAAVVGSAIAIPADAPRQANAEDLSQPVGTVEQYTESRSLEASLATLGLAIDGQAKLWQEEIPNGEIAEEVLGEPPPEGEETVLAENDEGEEEVAGKQVETQPTPGTVLFEDDFNDAENGRLLKTSYDPGRVVLGYVDGEYRIGRTDETWTPAGVFLPGNFTDVSIALDAGFVGGGDRSKQAVIIDCFPPEGFNPIHRLEFYGNGRVRLMRLEDGVQTFSTTAVTLPPDVVRLDGKNRLELSCVGQNIYGKVNERTFGSGQVSSAIDSGRIAIGAFGEMVSVEARVDNLVVIQGDPKVPAPVVEVVSTLPAPPVEYDSVSGIYWYSPEGQASNERERQILARERALVSQRLKEYFDMAPRIHPELARAFELMRSANALSSLPEGAGNPSSRDRLFIELVPSYRWNGASENPNRTFSPFGLSIAVVNGEPRSTLSVFADTIRDDKNYTMPHRIFPYMWGYNYIIRWQLYKAKEDSYFTSSLHNSPREKVLLYMQAFDQAIGLYGQIRLTLIQIEDSAVWRQFSTEWGNRNEYQRRLYVNDTFRVGASPEGLR